LSKTKSVNLSLEQSLGRKDLQIELLRKKEDIKEKTFIQKLLATLKDIGLGASIFAVGYFVGSL
tara:strand:- start:66 stop:257 length:192 start_codon:yes stop_codon:yes gene_type:complete